MTWNNIDPVAIPDGVSTPYGFVVDHPSYWGIPISGEITNRPPAAEDANFAGIANPPASLKISNIDVRTDQGDDDAWTGGDFSVLATCTPPFFHACHHKTDLDRGHHDMFEPRSERNVVERPFQPRNPLRGIGKQACVTLLDVTFKAGKLEQIDTANPNPILFSDFDSSASIADAIGRDYFAVSNGFWEVSKVRPLNAIWFVILQGSNTLLKRLGDGYRLWHRLNRDGEPDGYIWEIRQNEANAHHYHVEVQMSGALNKPSPIVECPRETVSVCFEYEWLFQG